MSTTTTTTTITSTHLTLTLKHLPHLTKTITTCIYLYLPTPFIHLPESVQVTITPVTTITKVTKKGLHERRQKLHKHSISLCFNLITVYLMG